MIETNHIYNMDCLEGMKRMADRSVDAVIADLPYGVLNRQNSAARWDQKIPLAPLWEQYLRITKPDSPIILFAQGMFTAELVLSQPKLWRYNLVWHKDRVSGHLNANRMPLRQHEDILVFYRKLPVYHPQMTPCPPEKRNHGRRKTEGLHQPVLRRHGAHAGAHRRRQIPDLGGVRAQGTPHGSLLTIPRRSPWP